MKKAAGNAQSLLFLEINYIIVRNLCPESKFLSDYIPPKNVVKENFMKLLRAQRVVNRVRSFHKFAYNPHARNLTQNIHRRILRRKFCSETGET
eukprot:UN08373